MAKQLEARFRAVIDSPLGRLVLASDGRALTSLWLPESRRYVAEPAPDRDGDDILEEAARQLRDYFSGERRDFDLPLAPAGTPFQLRVWRELCAIDFGQTISYGELARRVGNPAASRAVGAANGRNPIGLVIPCHRVIGANGSLTGYGGGLDTKAWLLRHESGVLAGTAGACATS